MPNYQNGKIYRLVCSETGNQYIGSTTQTLPQRKAGHKKPSNTCMSKLFINPDIILIETYPCDTKDELHKRERFHIENNECVNLTTPTRTTKEWLIDNKDKNSETLKKYQEKNKDKIKKLKNEYYQKNKERQLEKNKEYKEKNNEYITCECGSIIRLYNITTHKKTKKHIDYQNSINTEK